MKNQFFNTFLGFTPYWVYNPTDAIHVDSPGVYTSDEIWNFSTIDKIHLNCDWINGSIQNGCKQPILYSSVLDKPAG